MQHSKPNAPTGFTGTVYQTDGPDRVRRGDDDCEPAIIGHFTIPITTNRRSNDHESIRNEQNDF